MIFRKNDTDPSLTVTIERDGTAVNLTGATVTLSVRAKGSDTNKFTVNATITDAANGVCRFDWLAAHWDTVGKYDGELQVTYSDGGIETHLKPLFFKVVEEF